jgi:pimeloyl-ACP methyl ester carboxylesterase
MTIIDKGSGVPVVLVPGIQGRWEWMQPTVDALSRRCRVITFSLCDEPTSHGFFDETVGFDCYVQQISDALDACGVKAAIICGVSYGGLIAASFAARHPDRTRSVVVASAIPPSWVPDGRVRFLIRAPRLFSPIFCIRSLRLFGEMVAAREGIPSALIFAIRHLTAVATHRFSPVLMARRVRLLGETGLEAEVGTVRAPAFVITGQAELDKVVPVWMTREYLRLWPQAKTATLARTGHLGPITRPDEFADLVVRFAESFTQDEQRRRIVG